MADQMQRVEHAMTALVLDQPFFAVLAMKLNVQMSDAMPTFATDGRNLLINPDFCKTLKDKEIITVLAHEVLHCAMGHMWRITEGQDMRKWNVATDNEVNWELEAANMLAKSKGQATPFPWPACGHVMESQYQGWAAEKIYRHMPEKKQGDGKDKGQQGQPGGKGKQNGKSDDDGDQPSMGEVIRAAKDDKMLKEEWERAVVQAVKSTKDRGFIPASMEQLVKNVTSTKVDWRSLLRDMLYTIAKEDWSFTKANERYGGEFIMPSLHNEKAGNIIFAVDTSGSIDEGLLAEFIAEAQIALDDLNPESLTVVQCDAKIQKVETFVPGDVITCKVLGRGGTDFRPVFDWVKTLEEQPKVLIYLTDMEGSFPTEEPEFPVLWVTQREQDAPFGEVVVTQ